MDYPGATMFDEQFYLHRINRQRNNVPRRDHAFTVQARFMRLIMNFARTGNPTPRRESLLQNVVWPQVTDNLEYLDIGHDLKVGTQPFKERMDLWRDFDRRFSN
jgi:Carboxylesterase family